MGEEILGANELCTSICYFFPKLACIQHPFFGFAIITCTVSLDDVVVMLLKGRGEIYVENQSSGTYIEAVGLYCK